MNPLWNHHTRIKQVNRTLGLLCHSHLLVTLLTRRNAKVLQVQDGQINTVRLFSGRRESLRAALVSALISMLPAHKPQAESEHTPMCATGAWADWAEGFSMMSGPPIPSHTQAIVIILKEEVYQLLVRWVCDSPVCAHRCFLSLYMVWVSFQHLPKWLGAGIRSISQR